MGKPPQGFTITRLFRSGLAPVCVILGFCHPLSAVDPDDEKPFPDGVTASSSPTNRAIAGAEYFVGADPGEGSGTALSAEDNNFSAVTENMAELTLDVSGLAGGLHRVGTRFRDDLGNWSPVAFHDLFVFDLALVDAQPEAEPQVDFLTLDQLPATGTIVTVALTGTNYAYEVKAGDDLNDVKSGIANALANNPTVDTDLLADGRIRLTGKQAGSSHQVSLDANGSTVGAGQAPVPDFPPGITIVIAPTNRTIAAAEYFVGADPGEGSGTALSAEDNNFSAVTEGMAELALDVSGLAGGLHRVGTRFRDDLGNWSPVAFHDLFVFDLALVDAQPEAEPQVDFLTLDQLPATGTIVTVALATTNYAYEVKAGDDLNDVKSGIANALANNPTVDTDLLADGRIRLTGKQAGSSHQVSLDANGSTVGAGQAPVPDFPPGITIVIAPTNRTIAGAEYFVGADPGEGSGTALSAEDNNFSAVTEGMAELALDVSGLAGGLHRVGTRFRDDLGNWSPVAFHDLFVFDLALVDAQPEAEPQVDFLTLDQLPATGTVVTVALTGTNYAYEVKAGDDLNDVKSGIANALANNPTVDTDLLADGRIRLTGKQAGSSHQVSLDANGSTVGAGQAPLPDFLRA